MRRLVGIGLVFLLIAAIGVSGAWAVPEPTEVTVPEGYGRVKGTYKGSEDRLVVLLQDLHNHYEAQLNNARILDRLMDDYGLFLVAVEGATGLVDLTFYRCLPDPASTEKAAGFFLKQGDLRGEEYLAMIRRESFTIYGVEDQGLYLAQLKAYKDWRRLQEQALAWCQNLRDCLNRLKAYIYSPELKELDARRAAYEEGELSFAGYVQYLNRRLEKGDVHVSDRPNFDHLVRAIELEGEIDFGKVEEERAALISDLSERITAQALEELTEKDSTYRLGDIKASEYYGFLRDLAQGNDIEWEGFDNLAKYVEYITLYEGIDNRLLFDEVDRAEERIKEALYTDETQRRLSHLSQNLSILQGLFDNTLTPKEWRYYRSHKKEFVSGNFVDFIKEQGARYGLVGNHSEFDNFTSTLALPCLRATTHRQAHQGGRNFLEVGRIDALTASAERFYQVALDREEAMLRNTLEEMEREGVRMAVLVAGGFHTPSLTEMLRERDVSYVVVAPRVTGTALDNTPYWDRLAGKGSELEVALLTALSDVRTESAVKHTTGIGEFTPEQRDGLQRAYHTMVKGCFIIGANTTLSPSEMAEFIQRYLFDAFNAAEKEKTGLQLKTTVLPGGEAGRSYYINYRLEVPVEGTEVRGVDFVAVYLAKGTQGLLSVDMDTLIEGAEEYQLIGYDRDERGGYLLLAKERFDAVALREEASFYSLGASVGEEVPRSEEMEGLVTQLLANPDMVLATERQQALGEYLGRRSQSRDEATRRATCEDIRRIMAAEIPALGLERDVPRGYSPVVNIFDVSPRGEAVAMARLLPKTENVYNFVVVDRVKVPAVFGEGISGVITKKRIEAKSVQMFGRQAKDAAERLEAIVELIKTEELPRLREGLEAVEVHYAAMVSVSTDEQERAEALNSLSALQTKMENLMIVACVEPGQGQRLPIPEVQYGVVQQEASGRVLKGKSKAEDLARRLRRARLEQLYEEEFDNLVVVAPLNISKRMQQLYNSYVATAEAV